MSGFMVDPCRLLIPPNPRGDALGASAGPRPPAFRTLNMAAGIATYYDFRFAAGANHLDCARV